jgi:hypothetical protein
MLKINKNHLVVYNGNVETEDKRRKKIKLIRELMKWKLIRRLRLGMQPISFPQLANSHQLMDRKITVNTSLP